jgi:hypothetical protein
MVLSCPLLVGDRACGPLLCSDPVSHGVCSLVVCLNSSSQSWGFAEAERLVELGRPVQDMVFGVHVQKERHKIMGSVLELENGCRMAHCHCHQEFDESVASGRQRVSDPVTVMSDEHSDKLLLHIERMSSEEVDHAVYPRRR